MHASRAFETESLGAAHRFREGIRVGVVRHRTDESERHDTGGAGRELDGLLGDVQGLGVGRHAGVGEIDAHTAVAARPPSEIVAFRDPALRQDPDHAALLPWIAGPVRASAGGSRHDRFGAAASWNSAGSSTGTPP